MNRSMITNFLLFQLGWFACVLGGAHGQPVLGSLIAMMIIAFHISRAADAIKESRLLILALIIGFIFESIVSSQGFARYSHGQLFDAIAPLWMILMWPLFATTLNLSMRWLKGITPMLVALIGILFAPLAYYAGSRLGAVTYENLTLSMALIAIAWAALLPALVTMSLKLDGYKVTSLTPAAREQAQHV